MTSEKDNDELDASHLQPIGESDVESSLQPSPHKPQPPDEGLVAELATGNLFDDLPPVEVPHHDASLAAGTPAVPHPNQQHPHQQLAGQPYPAQQYPGQPLTGPHHPGQSPQRPAGPTNPSTVRTVRLLRRILVSFLGMSLLALAIYAWRSAEDHAANPPGYRFAATPEEKALQPEIDALAEEVAEAKKQLRGLEERRRKAATESVAAKEPTAVAGDSPAHKLVELQFSAGYYNPTVFADKFRTLNASDAQRRKAATLIAEAAKSRRISGSRAAHMAYVVNQPTISAEIVTILVEQAATPLDSDDRRNMPGMMQFVQSLSPEDRVRVLPALIMRHAASDSNVQSEIESLLRQTKPLPASISRLAFSHAPHISNVVKKSASPEVLWPAAFTALAADRHSAIAAAKWIQTQQPVAERRAKVLGALEPVIWVTESRRYVVLAAYLRWCTASETDRLINMLGTPGSGFAVPDIAKRLHELAPENTTKLIARHGNNPEFTTNFASRMSREPEYPTWVCVGLAESVPADPHADLWRAANRRYTSQHLPAMKRYLARMTQARGFRLQEIENTLNNEIQRLDQQKR